MRTQCVHVPESDASVAVEFWVTVYFIHGDSDSTGARVAAEVIAEVPRRQQTDLECPGVVIALQGVILA